ncbi:hypothetical protein Ahy_A08g039109 isoform D [Arachis hypogaea]|uniref:Uncharacterized protein n=1 Tax=Arachis hypogaea TaxID=3818 RepID=A0A445BV92_ARAHY|nr:hypothetical protein Ahy_A08g039109 isoform D [Arachis hypogaea]
MYDMKLLFIICFIAYYYVPSQEDIRIERIENKRFPSIPQPCNDCDSEMDECFLKTLELCFDFVIIVCSKNTTIY